MSKNLFLTIAIVMTSLFSFAQDGKNITVTIDNVSSNDGVVLLALHSKDTFMKAAPVQSTSTKIEDNKIVVTFENVAPGEYAVLASHDANSNGKMDFRENGMPLEDYGASNNVMNFGPPQFADAKFSLNDKNVKLNIRF